MKKIKLRKSTVNNLITYAIVALFYIVVTVMIATGNASRHMQSLLVPICVNVVLAVSLNLVIGFLGELSLGHAAFMSIGAYTGGLISIFMKNMFPTLPVAVRFPISLLAGGIAGAIFGALVCVVVLRLKGDYLAIVTLAFGEIIKELINCLIVGVDSKGLHIVFNARGTKGVNDLGLLEGGKVIVKGAQGATGTETIASFTAGFILIMITLIIVLNLVRSRSGRAIMALRDNRIAAESVGINVTKYKMMAFVTSAALAGSAGALYGLNYSNLVATKFDFNLSILVLVFVVLGGLGSIRGSIIAATILTVLPEALREFADYRMLVYAIVLIAVMLGTNNPQMKNLISKIIPVKKGGAVNG